MSAGRRSKWLAAVGLIMVAGGAQRIVEWSMYGYGSSQGRSMPAAFGTHALVTGALVAACGACLLVAGLRRKAQAAAEFEQPEIDQASD